MPTYELIVYGCQMNDYDGEKLAAIMEAAGYERAAEGDAADVVLVYTCAVRQSATARALGRITSLARVKKDNPRAIIGVGGCWPAVESDVIERACPHVDFTFGTTELENVPAALAEISGERGPSVPAEVSPLRKSWPRANVAIMRGCNNFCSYCVVPYARGAETYRPADDVLKEVEELLRAGFKDITLIGQNVNSYRRGEVTFARLLKKVDALCDGVFLRFITNHPRDFGDDAVDALAQGRNVARHLHLPLQSGSDAILHAMNRGYDMNRYLDVVSKVREAVPGICLTTDLLVGFPGETEAAFEETYRALEEIRFDSAYVFIYSSRPGTAAAALEDALPRAEKVNRLQTLAARQRAISLEINRGLIGEETVALVEGRSAKNAGEHAGRLSESKIVNFGGKARAGEFIAVKITAASPWTLRGELVT
ncbi:MAG: tRNA (N6-isopentenyl adenosine(37)-C2)-methylthiotransferase MiaB [candidate division Zixibacteria bacterium]|nr:tRNA (N6-isopentenyl adenosine(37)-C2)-methylthiotransferase MiaB [candidate division Zixibacteria bacterium]